MAPTNSEYFNIINKDEVFECEDCGGTLFWRTDVAKAKCADAECAVVYSVDFPRVETKRVLYKPEVVNEGK